MQYREYITPIEQQFKQSTSSVAAKIQVALTQLLPFSPNIPLPAKGDTYLRWQILSHIAAIDLNLAKIFESHLDALAILDELGQSVSEPEQLFAVWAAEGGSHPLTFNHHTISGDKMWCSAAPQVKYGLMTLRDTNQKSQLVLVDMQHPQITIRPDTWQAVGMHYTQTATLSFNEVPVEIISTPNAYLDRAGFWHGAAGVAACWYGAAVKLVNVLTTAIKKKPHAFKHVYLGEIAFSLQATRTLFQATAQRIDNNPHLSHESDIRLLRAQVEHTVVKVLEQLGKALGAAPFCLDADFAQTHADLTVFIRQSHAAFDLEKIGELCMQEDIQWTL